MAPMMKPVFVAVAILVLLQSSVAAAQEQPTTATIRGTVVTMGTDNPVAGAELRLTTFKAFNPRYPRQSSSPTVSPETTDRDGRFVIKDVAAGAYRLTIMRNGYTKQNFGQRVSNGPVPPLELGEGETKDLVIRLTPAGNISGVVRNTSGRPIAGVGVQLLQRVYTETGDRDFSTIASTETNDRGEYRFYWISPGRYYVMAGNDSSCRLARDACEHLSRIEYFDRDVEEGINANESGRQGGYGASYYPGVRDTERAAFLDVQPGAELRAVDFTLERLRYHIRGRVIDSATGQPPSWVGIEFHELGSGWTVYDDYTPGSLEISNLGPGTYWMRVSVEDKDSGRAPLAAAPVKFVIAGSDIDGVVFTLTPSSIITGRIRVEGDPQQSNLLNDLDIRLVSPTEPATSPGAWGSDRTWGAKNGAFTLSVSPDSEFRVTMPHLPQGFYLKEARLNGEDVLNAPAPLHAGTMELVVSSKGGQIEGVVSDDQSHPMPYVQAVLVPNGNRNRFELFKSATTDKAGRFTMSAIAPGDYTMFAWEEIELYSWFDPDVLKRYEARGQAVHVSESSQQTIEARLIPAGDAR